MPLRNRLLVGIVVAGLGGCAGGPNYDFWHPGNIQTQRLRAVVHDPYSDPDLGPAVVGGRPRDYIEPLPEAVRNRLYTDSFYGRR